MYKYIKSTVATMAILAFLVQACGENKTDGSNPRNVNTTTASNKNTQPAGADVVTDAQKVTNGKISMDLAGEKVVISVQKANLTEMDKEGKLSAAVTLDINGKPLDIVAVHQLIDSKPTQVSPEITKADSTTASSTQETLASTSDAKKPTSKESSAPSPDVAKEQKDPQVFTTALKPSNMNYIFSVIGLVKKSGPTAYYMAIRITVPGKESVPEASRNFGIAFGKLDQLKGAQAALVLDNVPTNSAGQLGSEGLITFLMNQFPASPIAQAAPVAKPDSEQKVTIQNEAQTTAQATIQATAQSAEQKKIEQKPVQATEPASNELTAQQEAK